MMKKARLLLLICLLLLPAFSQAEDISLSKARSVAETFFNNCGASTRSSSQLTLVNADEISATRSASDVAFYIFNRQGGGFVIISALDAAVPVLGYSLTDEFGTGDDMPENLAEWLDLYRQQIGERRRSGKAATADELVRWKEVTQSTRAVPSSIELNTANWGQGAPYNGLCPLDTAGKKTIAGCTAIAISQVVYYHKHPNAGTGTLPAYTKNGISIKSVPLGHQYKYDKMLHKYKGATYTKEQSDAVARLVYDIAVMAQASFGSGSTSASTSAAVPRLRTYFGYDKGMIRYAHNFLDDTGWKDMLKEEIGNRYPVIFSATSSTSGGGHAFVVDGYDSSDRFHVNWGWNGSSNGYYQLSAFGAYTVSQ
ncbi:MAG: C10 family peptidase, partial [Bacteroidales bacterium]|nr:C10 family peptidase [Bacteroidales bacterium]